MPIAKKLKKFWKSLGPGIITGASGNDPSAITTYIISGARAGYAQLWSVIFILPFMVALQEMSARIGALSSCGLAGNIKRHYPGWLLLIIVLVIVSANVVNLGANIYGMAGALNLIIPIDINLLAVLTAGFTLLFTINLYYKQIVSIFKWIALSLFVYVFAFLAIDAPWSDILRHAFIPTIHIDREFLIILFGVVGTTLSPYLYFWQASEEAEEQKINHPRFRVCKFRPLQNGKLKKIETDTMLGMIFSNFISFFIIALSGTVLYGLAAGDVETLRDAANALQPVVGEFAYLLFTLGIVGSGILAIPVLAGSAAFVLAELFNWKSGFNNGLSKAREFYIVMTLAVGLSLLIPLLGISPVQALFWTAVLNGLISPVLILLLVHMSNNTNIVGQNTSSRNVTIGGYIIFFLMLAGAIFVLTS